MKERLKNYGLWLAIIAFIPILCESLGVNVLPANYTELTTSALGILVLLGLVNNPTTESKWFLDDVKSEDKVE